MRNSRKIYFFALITFSLTFCFSCSSNLRNCNKLLEFNKINGSYFSELEIKPKTPINLSTNSYILFDDNSELGTLFINDTPMSISNFLYNKNALDTGIVLSLLTISKITLGKENTFYLITYNVDNFLGTNGEIVGVLIDTKNSTLSKIIYIPLSDIYTIGDADKNEKIDILTINNGDDNFLSKNSKYNIVLSEFDSNGTLTIKNKGIVSFVKPDLLIDTCKYSFIKNL